MKKLYMMPLLLVMMIMMAVSVMGAYDAIWRCPQAGTSSTNTVIKNYMTYEDDPPYVDCQKSGNNFTIEFQISGTAGDWFQDTDGMGSNHYNATLYLYKGSNQQFVLPIAGASNFTNTSATTSDLFRWTDFGEISTNAAKRGGIPGYPLWYNNLTEGGYKYYVYVELNNGTGGGSTSQLLSSEKGLDDSNPVHFVIDHRGSAAKKLVGAAYAGAPGTDDAQAALRREGVDIGGIDKTTLVVLLIVVVIFYYLWKNKKKA